MCDSIVCDLYFGYSNQLCLDNTFNSDNRNIYKWDIFNQNDSIVLVSIDSSIKNV